VGRVFQGEREVWRFDLLPEPGHKMPAFVNLQQYHVEQFLIERCQDFPALVDLRWKNRVTGLERDGKGVRLRVATPDGAYQLAADWVVACDGVKSAVRDMMGLALEGQSFEERFLIADVEMKADFPSERQFWFRPPFHDGETALLHKQPDDIWRIDLQLGPQAVPEVEKRPENVIPRIAKAVGGRPFELDWVSVYNFRCARLARFVHGRVIFAGDSAHVVSPFGARGGNGGIHDADNLCWKLAMVVQGEAGPAHHPSYDEERGRGADEKNRNSARATAFMSPQGEAAVRLRVSVLALSGVHPFARRQINTGRLSDAC
jgi:3-(3-hydroxy-phenyl)propionate hydroxylase